MHPFEYISMPSLNRYRADHRRPKNPIADFLATSAHYLRLSPEQLANHVSQQTTTINTRRRHD